MITPTNSKCTIANVLSARPKPTRYRSIYFNKIKIHPEPLFEQYMMGVQFAIVPCIYMIHSRSLLHQVITATNSKVSALLQTYPLLVQSQHD